jgi:putative modified peptide
MAGTSEGGHAAEPKLTVSKEQAEKFVDKLANDDAFRTKLQNDPVGAMGDLVIKLPPGTTIPKKVDLPSKEAVAANRPRMMKFAPVFGPRCPIPDVG